MKAQMNDTGMAAEGRTVEGGRGILVGGLVLISMGLVLLVSQLLTLGAWFLVMQGLIFTAAGAATRASGWLIPGGVLNGIGLGALLIESGLPLSDTAEGGVFLLAFALGWLSIYVLSRLLTAAPLRWALIPAGVMALIGAPLLFGEAGEAALEVALRWSGYAWPVVLIGAGLAVLARLRQR